MENPSDVRIIYDGECPFCASFVKMVRLRETFGSVKLIDARESQTDLIRDLKSKYRLDDGFIIIHANREYYGSDALEFIALATSDSAASRFLMRNPFFKGKFGRVTYPVMVKLRKLALRLLGRTPMGY